MLAQNLNPNSYDILSKHGHLLVISFVVIYFWVPTKKYIYIYIYSKEIQKIIGARKGCSNAEKIPKLVEEVQKCKMVKFNSIFFTDERHVDKENSIEENKSKIRYLWT